MREGDNSIVDHGSGIYLTPINNAFMVGAFPPPVHGMATVNAAVRDAFQLTRTEPKIIDLAAPSLERSLKARLGKLPKVLRGLSRIGTASKLRGGTLYISVSGGFGQLYDIAFVVLARLRGMKLYLHHHSFAYLDMRSRLTGILIRTAGASAVHVSLCSGMADRLKTLYGVEQTVRLSNTVFLLSGQPVGSQTRHSLQTMGFISNISAEKGVFEFLDLAAAIQCKGLPLRAKLAGPFQDSQTEIKVRARLANLPSVEYVGAKYGVDKDDFFAGIDALIFPTHNEAEPLTLHEAMSRGIPVIAYGRGCIPEIVGPNCGLAVEPGEPFVPPALTQIEAWLADPPAFEAASKVAAERFAKTYAESEARWKDLLAEMIGSRDATKCIPGEVNSAL